LTLGATAQAALITFDSDTDGLKANPFQSVDSNAVTFSNSAGSGLSIGSTFGVQCAGSRCLSTGSDNPGVFLIMNFTSPFTTLSLDFGNDDPGWSVAGDLAVLRLFYDAGAVGTVSVVMNRDDIMNQTISYSGAAFNRAEFEYVVPQGNTGGLNELVDNVNFGTAVPEPSSWVVMLSGVAALGLRRLRAQRRCK
jgi:hypothetical protein